MSQFIYFITRIEAWNDNTYGFLYFEPGLDEIISVTRNNLFFSSINLNKIYTNQQIS